jgi:hypothetical protein
MKNDLKSHDKEYRAWIQTQPSCISGEYSEYVHGDGRCIAAHVRRANRSGTGFKALYACVPMTDAEHRVQHQAGELACLITFGGKQFADFTVDDAKKWFDDQVRAHFKKWGKA